jgi:hypothetical protein
MPGRNPFAESWRQLAAVPLVLVVLAGCDRRTPMAPSREALTASPAREGVGLTVSGYVYQTLTRDSGEPPITGALITLRDAAGIESTAVSDRHGFYRVQATASEVVVSVVKEGYSAGESRFDLAESTVLNFSLAPVLRSPL